MAGEGIEAGDSAGAQDQGEPDSAGSAVKRVADTSLPLEVGSVALGEDGHIRNAGEDRPLHFRFTACGVIFEAELSSRTAPLRLRANLGKLPYSAESPEARGLARTVIASTDRLRHGHILLSPEQDMLLEGELNTPGPHTPMAVIATAVALVLDFKPYLELLGEAVSIRRQPPDPHSEETALPAEG